MVNRPDAESRLGGDTVQMQETAAALRRQGVNVEIALGPQPVSVYRSFDLVHLFNLQTSTFSVGEARKVREADRPLALSTIYWNFRPDQLLVKSAKWGLLARLLGRKAAWRLADARVRATSRTEQAEIRELVRLADVCLPNSAAEAEQLRRFGTPKAVQVVPNGIDVQRFDPSRSLALPAWAEGFGSRNYLLIVARLEEDKNQIAYLRAIRPLGIPTVLVGKEAEPGVGHVAEGLGAKWVGSLAGDELVAAYAHARVHALPSYRETPGLASLEAAAMGCAVVSTEVGSAREYFADDAHYCLPWDAAGMAQATQTAWSEGVSLDRAARIRSKFGWDQAGVATYAGYEFVLKV